MLKPFQNRLKEDALGAVRDRLLRVDDADAVLLQAGFIGRAVVTVTGEAVDLITENDLPLALRAVADHFLELLALVSRSRQGAVCILGDDLHVVPARPLAALPELLLNGSVLLGMAGITSIKRGPHHSAPHKAQNGPRPASLFFTASERLPPSGAVFLFFGILILRALLLFFFKLEGVRHEGGPSLNIEEVEDPEKLNLGLVKLTLMDAAVPDDQRRCVIPLYDG